MRTKYVYIIQLVINQFIIPRGHVIGQKHLAQNHALNITVLACKIKTHGIAFTNNLLRTH